MWTRSFSKSMRDSILRRGADAVRSAGDAAERGDLQALDNAKALIRQLEELYSAGLPRVVMSCCPFDGKPLVRTFDPFGLDGDWWRADFPRPDPAPCRHFCVLRGAVHFRGLRRVAGGFEVSTGPEVPYVIPRILSMPTMLAVIGEVPMETGYVAYTIGYFAETRPPAQDLTVDWPGRTFSYRTAMGEVGWKPANDPWDFELRPWLEARKLLWCVPDTHNQVIDWGDVAVFYRSRDAPAACPYAAVEGDRYSIGVKDDSSWSNGLPDGKVFDHLD